LLQGAAQDDGPWSIRDSGEHQGVVAHTVRRLHDDDRTLVDGIPVTAIPRTLLDVAEVAPHRLERAIEAAERLGLFDLGAVNALIERSHGRHGLRALDAALRAYRDPPVTQSELERLFLDLCRDADIPTPACNVSVAGNVVDAVWEDRPLVVELDGRAFHSTRAAFERDRKRDADLQLAGYRVLRVTHRRLSDEPGEVVSAVRALLTAAPS